MTRAVSLEDVVAHYASLVIEDRDDPDDPPMHPGCPAEILDDFRFERAAATRLLLYGPDPRPDIATDALGPHP
jgi:hypothetical protein